MDMESKSIWVSKSMWYKPKSTSSSLKPGAQRVYTFDEWTLLTKIVALGFWFVCFLFALTISWIALSAASHQHAKAAAAVPTATASTANDTAQPASDNDTAQPPPVNDAAQPPPARPNLSVWLRDVEGLDPCSNSSPAFHVVVDADEIPPRYRYCSGGGNSMLRVSHRGIILAWGHVPWFCVEGSQSQCEKDGFVDGVVTVQARADGAVLREEVRSSVHNDLCVDGKAQFTVEGEVAGLGYLRCETTLLQGSHTESYPCLVQ